MLEGTRLRVFMYLKEENRNENRSKRAVGPFLGKTRYPNDHLVLDYLQSLRNILTVLFFLTAEC